MSAIAGKKVHFQEGRAARLLGRGHAVPNLEEGRGHAVHVVRALPRQVLHRVGQLDHLRTTLKVIRVSRGLPAHRSPRSNALHKPAALRHGWGACRSLVTCSSMCASNF